jgi:hypothetical protein
LFKFFSLFLSFFFFFSLLGAWDWTQGLMHAKCVLYHLATSLAP